MSNNHMGVTEQSFDVCVTGATPAGVAAAVRAARAGYRVVLTQHTAHLGGMCTNGLGQWDAKSDHRRCPIFAEILDRLETHYRETYGPESTAHHAARYTVKRYPVGSFEPSVIERIFNELVAAEANLTVWTGFYAASASVIARAIRSVVFRAWGGQEQRTVSARVYIDATYEGDVAAIAGVPCRVGREGQDEHAEPHAGRLFTQMRNQPGPSLALRGALNTLTFHLQQGPTDPASPGDGDGYVQAYNLRACVSRDPASRILLERPPERYDRAEFMTYTRRSLAIVADINGKNTYNSAILPGENRDYPDGDWPTRRRIDQRHRDFALGLMWFLQNDPSIPAERREAYRTWGLASDEYADNGHLPYEIYVREARRIVGRHVLTENDLLPRDGFMRPRPFHDSIAFTDWYMDSHSCTPDVGTWGPGYGMSGSEAYPYDGKLILSEEFRPGMIPYRSMVPENLDNLLVPVCLSSTHVAWGALRLEPVWIHLGEVAGFAACQCLGQGQTVTGLDVSRLQHTLLSAGASIAFFNQHRDAGGHSGYAQRQLAACHGEWDGYDLD
jgi:hypothetical protein